MGWLQADCTFGDSWVRETLSGAIGNGFTVDMDVFLSSDTLLAVATPQYTANWLEVAVGGITFGWLGAQTVDSGATAQLLLNGNALSATTLPLDTSFHILYQAVWNSGASMFDVTVKVNGVTADTYQQGSVNTASLRQYVEVGGISAEAVSGELYWFDNFIMKDSGGSTLWSDDFEGALSWNFNSGSPSIVAAPTPGAGSEPPAINNGGVRVGIAFDDPTLEPDPTWTYLTDTSGLVASYEIDRGRQFEFDRTDTGTATVRINDREGVLDPTNSTGPYYTKIEPLLQIKLELWNPVSEDFHIRYRGFIEDFDYVVAPFTHQEGSDTVGVTFLEIGCVDLFEILTAIEMQPGEFGDTPPAGGEGNIFFDNAAANDRIEQVLTNAVIDPAFYVVFTLNVNMPESTYSPSENVLQVVQDGADAEFPTVSNVYVDRYGRLAVHGRLAKFDPGTTASGAGPDAWDYHHWQCGDGKAVALSPTDTAQFREFAFNRGLSKVFNSSLCTPTGIDDPPPTPTTSDIPGQLFKDPTSIGLYGIRSWSAENLLIGAPTGDVLHAANAGILTGNSALEECLLFATFITANYKTPRNRISTLTFKSMHPDWTGAAATWDLLTKVDISDAIDATVSIPSTGGFNLEPGFIEGIHETATPLNGVYALVTTSLDVSPRAYFDNPEGLDGL